MTISTTASTTIALNTATIKPEPQEMDDQLFQQLFQLEDASATAAPAPWLSPDFFVGPQSVHSTPEIATPQDMFLPSPASPSFDKQQQQMPIPGFGDLDVSALLDMASPMGSPLPLVHQQQQQCAFTAPLSNPVSHGELSVGLFGDLSAALAALAAGTVVPHPPHDEPSRSPAVSVLSSSSSTSPIVQTIHMPAVTEAPSASRKRSRQASEQPASLPAGEVALKRQKNADAARRSRLRKVLKIEALEARVAELEKGNTTLLLRAAVLESEKSGLLAKESFFEQRIKTLEAQLYEAHQSLAGIVQRQ